MDDVAAWLESLLDDDDPRKVLAAARLLLYIAQRGG